MTETNKEFDFNSRILNEKEQSCKIANYKCEDCPYYCHCNNTGDEFHCIYECDAILCPLI